MNINIGRDFDEVPSGRYRTDGPASGEVFREDFLKPALSRLEKGEKIEVTIDDNVDGYGSSFLDEGFAGAVRDGSISSKALVDSLIIAFTNPEFEFYRDMIYQYIEEAGISAQ